MYQMEDFIKSHPHKYNITISKYGKHYIKFDYILPGCVIINGTKSFLRRCTQCTQNIRRILEIVPKDINIYIFCDADIDIDYYKNDIQSTINIIDHTRFVKLINNVNDIHINEWYYAAMIPYAITYISETYIEKYMNKLYIPSLLYGHTEALYGNTFNIDKYNPITTIDIHLNPIVILTYNPKYKEEFNYTNIENLFMVFFDNCPKYPGQPKSPIKHIDNITEICDKCGFIYFIVYNKSPICKTCGEKVIINRRKPKTISWWNKILKYEQLFRKRN